MLGAWLPTAAAEEVAISPNARKLFEAGVTLLEDKGGPRYEEAYRVFKSAYEDSPAPAILGNIALCAMELERDGEAIALYRRYLAEVTDIADDEREQIEKDIQVLEASSATLELEVTPEGTVVVDERTPATGPVVRNRYGPFDTTLVKLRVRAGAHRLRFEAPDGTRREASLVVKPGESREVRLERPSAEPPPPPAPPGLPIPYVSRPLTLPAGTLAPALGLRVGQELPTATTTATYVGLALADMQIGILDDLELDVLAAPIELRPRIDYGTATARLTYRYLDTAVELGSALHLGHVLLPGGKRRFLLEPQFLRLLAHAGDVVRVDSGISLPVYFGGDAAAVGLTIPLAVAAQPHELFHVGLGTGFGISDFSAAGASSVYIPMGVFTGVTVPLEERPLLDVFGRFGFPSLFVPGRADDKVEERAFGGIVSFRLYFSL